MTCYLLNQQPSRHKTDFASGIQCAGEPLRHRSLHTRELASYLATRDRFRYLMGLQPRRCLSLAVDVMLTPEFKAYKRPKLPPIIGTSGEVALQNLSHDVASEKAPRSHLTAE